MPSIWRVLFLEIVRLLFPIQRKIISNLREQLTKITLRLHIIYQVIMSSGYAFTKKMHVPAFTRQLDESAWIPVVHLYLKVFNWNLEACKLIYHSRSLIPAGVLRGQCRFPNQIQIYILIWFMLSACLGFLKHSCLTVFSPRIFKLIFYC